MARNFFRLRSRHRPTRHAAGRLHRRGAMPPKSTSRSRFAAANSRGATACADRSRALGRGVAPSEAQRELIDVARVNKDPVGQYISANQALDVLASERGLDREGLDDHTVGEDEADDVLEAGNVF